MSRSDPSTAPVTVHRHPGGDAGTDRLAVEEPMEIRLHHGDGQEDPIAVTLRTPGQDEELALGFLFAEGVIDAIRDVTAVEAVGEPAPGTGLRNRIRVSLAADAEVDLSSLDRHVFSHSGCGVCGKRTIEALARRRIHSIDEGGFAIDTEVLLSLPDRLREAQKVFAQTGALHAAARFDAGGTILAVREDVGRHNALDKLIGAALAAGEVPLSREGLLVSGRTSFELMQKAVTAGCPMLAAVGAPSSLAVAMARELGVTLVGFLRDGRFNLYAHPERVTGI